MFLVMHTKIPSPPLIFPTRVIEEKGSDRWVGAWPPAMSGLNSFVLKKNLWIFLPSLSFSLLH